MATSHLILGTDKKAGWKTEDDPHTSGDVGILALSVRATTTPVTTTSAAGDYAATLVDQEGKQILSGSGGPETSWDACVDITAATSTLLVAAGAAGIRRYITDVTLSNPGAAAIVVNILDGATRKYSRSILPGASVDVQFKTPIRGTAATAINATMSTAGTVTVSIAGYLGV